GLQNMVNAINALLGSYGATIDLDNPSLLRNGSDSETATFMEEVSKGEVSAVIFYNCNPVYTHPKGADLAKSLKSVDLSVSFSDRPDETSSLCNYNCPDLHALESWNDFEPRQGAYSFSQPTIAPLFQGRQAQESLLQWAGASAVFHDYMKQNWSSKGSWEKLIQDGVLENTPTAATSYACKADLNAAVASAKAGNGMELVIYEKTGLGNGVQANNPWLQELPDPITKITWDNYVTVAPSDAREKGWKQGNVVAVKAGNVTAKLPVVVQPGQAAGSIGVALGYGRTIAGKVADTRGVNVYPMVAIDGTNLSYNISGVSVDKTTDDDYLLAGTQTHHTMMGREIVKETTLASWQKDPKAGNPEEMLEVHVGHEKTEKPVEKVTLWDEFESGHHHWGMSIDLNSCIGCGSCVVACSAENNVPVVGKEEVMRSREMHWMRIDRYYSSDADPKEGEKGDINLMEVPSDNPRVVFQPVMCQHCNHAPCETVCPVIATSHSSEGMNQMTYNRCVGTRYCANNCPYKVRRFNWFKYSDNSQFASVNTFMNDDLGKMVLNPDVTVRSRGVMEKCSLCVQRIQEGKLNAKRAGQPIADGQVQTACAQSCPTNAITFGDYNNKDSRINKMWDPKGRSYHLLRELNVQPNVFYLTKVRNIEAGKEA
ncbi:MAG: 4Fe-4S dicluster domain-containing protein, partial [Bacteroidota bacterium]